MFAEFKITQDNTLPWMDVVLGYKKGTPIDLTDVIKITFSMRPIEGGKLQVNTGNVTVLGDPTEGRVRYEWTAKDTEVAGRFYGQFRVVLPDGIISVPNGDDYVHVFVNPKVG